MREQDLDGLAGGWLFAHLRVAPSPQTGNPIVFEPALLINYAAPRRGGGAAELQDRADLRRPRWGSAWPTAWRQSVNSAVSAASASGLGRWTGLWSWGEAVRYRGGRGGPSCF